MHGSVHALQGVLMSHQSPARTPCNQPKYGCRLRLDSAFTSTTACGCRALYHCNYCQRDISAAVRIKCAVCPDFDLCLECFSVGAQVWPHRSDHAYRVVDNLSFPLFHPDWGVRARCNTPPFRLTLQHHGI